MANSWKELRVLLSPSAHVSSDLTLAGGRPGLPWTWSCQADIDSIVTVTNQEQDLEDYVCYRQNIVIKVTEEIFSK